MSAGETPRSDDEKPPAKDCERVSFEHILPTWFATHFEHHKGQPTRTGKLGSIDITLKGGGGTYWIETKSSVSRLTEKQIAENITLISSLVNGRTAEEAEKVLIERPPGHRAIVILQVFLPKSVYERVYGQMVADSREEYYDAYQRKDFREAAKIKRHLNYSLVMSAVAYIASLPLHLIPRCFNWFDKSE